MESNINYLAIITATIVSMGIGAIWYSPILFVKPWMKLISKDEKDIENGGKDNLIQMLTLTFIAIFITAFVLSVALSYTKSQGPIEGALLGFWIWAGFVATTSLPNFLFKGAPIKLYLIENGHDLVMFMVMGAILASWPM